MNNREGEFLALTPFLSITIPFVMGIILGVWAFIILPLLFIPKIRKQWIIFVVLLAGSSLKIIHNHTIPLPVEERVEVVAVVSEIIPNYLNCRVISMPYRSNILIETVGDLAVGDTLATTLYLEEIEKHRNDTKSIFNSYMLRGVDYVGYIYDDTPIELKRVCKRRDSFQVFRDNIIGKISDLSTSNENKGVLKALIVGDRGELLSKTKIDYRKAGVIHTLAVSGMHVGIIYLMLNILLMFLNLTVYSRVVKIIIIISLLICYAYLCNFTPSVVRAVMMFSLFQLTSFTITSRYHSYNILLLSAFLMIALNPMVIWDVSFQFSYAAMFAVLFSALKSKESQISNNYLIKKSLTLVVVPTFVSLFMLPFILYYFGEGSLFSLVSNMAMSLLLPLLFIASTLYFIAPLELFDRFIDLIFTVINFVVDGVGGWDIFYLTNVEFDIIDLLLSYLALFMIIYAISFRQTKESSDF